MSEEPPDQPAPPATPSEPPPPAAPADPTIVNPAPPAQPGLISAAPVGWTAPTPPPAGPVGWADPAATPPAAPPPGSTGATVGWAPVAPPREVAPGLSYADTISRFIAYVVDVILIGIVGGIIAAILGSGQSYSGTVFGRYEAGYRLSGAGYTVPVVILSLAYFVFFWSGGRRATIGQRIFGIQVGNAFDGHPLSIQQALRRWVGLGLFLSLLDLVLPSSSWLGLVQLVWWIVLLGSTALSPTNQGLHDKFANSALVRPSGSGAARGLALACSLIVGLFLVFAILGVVALILLGSQLSDILSQIGDSI